MPSETASEHRAVKRNSHVEDINTVQVFLMEWCFEISVKKIRKLRNHSGLQRLKKLHRPFVMNSTSEYSNMTQMSVYNIKNIEIVRISLYILTFFCLCVFLCFITGILRLYFNSAHIKENPRYILFVHMLINDTIYLVLGLFLVFATTHIVHIPVPICYILVTVTSTSFKVTPYNLAAMALERYIAICFPLRHAEICNRQKANVAIIIIWAVGLIPNIADFISLTSTVEKNYFLLSVICSRATFTITTVQNNIRAFTHTFTFSLVALIIIVTYIEIMLVAMKIDSSTASASKAGKTVMLHAIQLMLCMLAFTYSITETYLRTYVAILPLLNFFFLMCLPRFLSPFIYGMRDEMFQTYNAKEQYPQKQTKFIPPPPYSQAPPSYTNENRFKTTIGKSSDVPSEELPRRTLRPFIKTPDRYGFGNGSVRYRAKGTGGQDRYQERETRSVERGDISVTPATTKKVGKIKKSLSDIPEESKDE
ncbi:odorant receptor 131-2-like [Bombina bombina]|uniref:odorant receptor 131-2-like n=1 Tax=Bombina bombina TaxID=8345 RepID=UPI00235ABF2F|nr:odorant receptor 131-2-like [Bombina bombina]